MSFHLKLFHRRREKASSPKNSDDALPAGPTLAETSSAKPNPQLQSLFLTRLPLDVRLLIYEHIIVVKPRLHVVGWNPHAKLSHFGCEEPGNDSIRHAKCWNHRKGEGELLKPAVVNLGILQTCSLVYVHSPTATLPFYFPDLSYTDYQTFRRSRFVVQAKRIRPSIPHHSYNPRSPYPSHLPQSDSRYELEPILVCLVSRIQRRKPETEHMSSSIQVPVEKGLRCTN